MTRIEKEKLAKYKAGLKLHCLEAGHHSGILGSVTTKTHHVCCMECSQPAKPKPNPFQSFIDAAAGRMDMTVHI